MMPKTFTSANLNVLPFETFRTFGPLFDKHWPVTAWAPPCDIYETDEEVVLKMELPDMRKEDIHVTFENTLLTVRGERKFEARVNRESYHRVERKYGEFIRTFTLPTTLEGNKVVAEFKEGMLTVRLPKNAAAVARKIEVNVI
jgi:HSP20 family protein